MDYAYVTAAYHKQSEQEMIKRILALSDRLSSMETAKSARINELTKRVETLEKAVAVLLKKL